MAILEFDIGNTRLKWRLITGDVVEPIGYLSRSGLELDDGATSGALFDDFKDMIFERSGQAIEAIRIVSVRSELVNRRIALSLSSAFNVEPSFARTLPETAGVVNSYRDPDEMGVDRWSAIVAAAKGKALARPCCVVDAGSAVTIECIDAAAKHLRGFILPGYRMQVRSLLRATDKVAAADALLDLDIDLSKVSSNTVESVSQGVILNILGAVDAALAMLIKSDPLNLKKEPLLIFTGGDAHRLASCGRDLFDWNVQVDEALVLDGLAHLLPVAEEN